MLMALACMDTGHRARLVNWPPWRQRQSAAILGTLADGSPVHPKPWLSVRGCPEDHQRSEIHRARHKAPRRLMQSGVEVSRAYICLALETSVEQLGLDPAAGVKSMSIGVLAAGKNIHLRVRGRAERGPDIRA